MIKETLKNAEVYCPICGKDCWKDRMKLVKHLVGEQPFYIGETYNKLAEEHPPFRPSPMRKTPPATFARDIYKNKNFKKIGRGKFILFDENKIFKNGRNKWHMAQNKAGEIIGKEISVSAKDIYNIIEKEGLKDLNGDTPEYTNHTQLNRNPSWSVDKSKKPHQFTFLGYKDKNHHINKNSIYCPHCRKEIFVVIK